MGQVKNNLNATSLELNEVNGRLNMTAIQYDTLKNQCDANLTVLNSQYSTTRDKLSETEAKLNSTTQELADVTLKHNTSLSELEKLKTNLTSTTSSMASQIQSLTSDISHTKGQLTTAQHDFNQAKSQLGECQTNLDKFTTYKGHRYLLGPSSEVNIDSYMAYCTSHHGYLVEIDDAAEWEFVKNFIRSGDTVVNGVLYHNTVAYLGARDLNGGDDNTFTLLHSRKPATFFDWGRNQPLHKHQADGAGMDCIYIGSNSQKMYTTYCYHVTMWYRPLCEIPV